ncbi:MAG TPA: hypothetical protein VKU82_10165 [Planctomycetaceae bacterium]|nr:hypothetical protein [Planctomycetaceae bacterium]
MQHAIDVFIISDKPGKPRVESQHQSPAVLEFIPTGIGAPAEFPGTEWASRLIDGDSEFAALVIGQHRDESIAQAVLPMLLTLKANNHAAEVMVERVDSARFPLDLTCAFTTGHGINILLAPRSGWGTVVFRRSKLKQLGPLKSLADPVWDWLIRAARSGERISAIPIHPELASGKCRLPHLVSTRPDNDSNWLRRHLKDYSAQELGLKPGSSVGQTALRAGLNLWHDFDDECHQLAQSIEGQGADQLGDYWHAILHRREPDYSNAKYWFRQIGQQQIFRELAAFADSTLGESTDARATTWRSRIRSASHWDPFAFVDLCEECGKDETTDLALAVRRIQFCEMSLLMRMTVENA